MEKSGLQTLYYAHFVNEYTSMILASGLVTYKNPLDEAIFDIYPSKVP